MFVKMMCSSVCVCVRMCFFFVFVLRRLPGCIHYESELVIHTKTKFVA